MERRSKPWDYEDVEFKGKAYFKSKRVIGSNSSGLITVPLRMKGKRFMVYLVEETNEDINNR
jgi:hypothetical protein